jgi:hypothetical protein
MSSSGGGYAGQSSSDDRTPQLRWTRDLHKRFVLAVSELGGADSESSRGQFLLRLCIDSDDHGLSLASLII